MSNDCIELKISSQREKLLISMLKKMSQIKLAEQRVAEDGGDELLVEIAGDERVLLGHLSP